MGNLDGKININSVIPNTIMNYGEYYTKLQRLAMYADQGDYKSMQKVLDNQAVLDRKNMLLQPLFRDLKSQIRHMSYTPEFALVQEYLTVRKQLQQSIVAQTPQKQSQILEQLRDNYADLLRIENNKFLTDTTVRLKTLQKRLEDIFELLNAWQSYIDVIYMTDFESTLIDAVGKDEVDLSARSGFA